jgi:hypothetical protein
MYGNNSHCDIGMINIKGTTLNDSFEGSVFSLDANVSLDNDGKPNEPFREEIYLHELVYDEAHLVSRWAFEEANGSRIRDLGIAVNDGYLVGNSALVAGKFGNAISMDGSGDYMSVPRFSGTHKDGKPRNTHIITTTLP